MDIIVHYPKEQNDLHELEKKVAAAHAEAVIRQLRSLSCPKEQKERLLKELIKCVQ